MTPVSQSLIDLNQLVYFSVFLPYTLGIKITIGLSILLQSAKKSAGSFSGSAFSNFVKKLQENGYFEGELEHSKRWTELHCRAKSFFITSVDDKKSNESFRFQGSVFKAMFLMIRTSI